MEIEATAPRRGIVVALAAFALLVVALTLSPMSNNDIFLHLRTGQIVLDSGAPPHLDDYSALARGRPFIAHEWLAGVVFDLTERLGGLAGLVLLKVVVALAMAGALYAAARTLGAPPLLALPLLALVMVLAAARIMERPHIFSYLLTSIYLLLLARYRRGGARRAPLWPFLPLQIAWANLHGAFLLGPLIVILAAAGLALDWLAARLASRGRTARDPSRQPDGDRRLRDAGHLGLLACSLLAVCLVNPYGVALLTFPFQLTASSFMREIYEWQPPFGSDFASTYMVIEYLVLGAIGIGVLVGAAVRSARGADRSPEGVFTLLLFAVLGALSLRMQRNVTDFALGTYPGVAATGAWLRLGGRDRSRSNASAVALALVFLSLAAWFVVNGYPFRPASRRPFGFGVGRNIPVAAADYVQARGLEGNVFNSYAAGAYLVYRFHPRVRVAMDSRNDVYGADLYAAYNRALVDEEALRAMLERIDASFIFLEWTRTPATIALARHLGWVMIYFDDTAVVLVRNGGPFAGLADRDGYTVPDPGQYRPATPPPPGLTRAAGASMMLHEATRAAEASRGAYVARVMQIDALLTLGRAADAAKVEAGILRERPPLPYIYGFLGMLRLAAGDRSAAIERFRRGLALNASDPTSIAGLRLAVAAP